MSPGSVSSWRWFDRVMLALLGAALAYTLYRALTLRVDQWDAFLYLNNAVRFLGIDTPYYQLDKPPLVPALYMPVVEHTRGEPASMSMLIAPHLHATLLSFLSMGAVFLSMRTTVGVRFALVATVLTVGNRVFMRYAPLALTDVIAAGFVAAAFYLFWEARTRRKLIFFVLAGISVGLAAASRYQFVLLPFAFGLSELAVGLKERRFYDRRWLGLAIVAGLSGIVFLYAHKLAYEAIGREASIPSLIQAIEYAGAGARRQWEHEEPWHYLQMLSVVLSPLVLLASVGGFAVALYRRRDRDFFFAAWLFFTAAPLFRVDHNEVRYLYAAFPAVIYFALLPLEELAAHRIVRAFVERPHGSNILLGASALGLAVALFPGVDQVRRDTDPFFEEDVIRASSAWLIANAPEDAPYYWYGRPHTLHPDDMHLLVHDEFFNVFNFGYHEFIYFTGRPMEERRYLGSDPVAAVIRDAPGGAGVLLGTVDDFNTRELIEHGIPDPAVAVFTITRVTLRVTESSVMQGGDMSFHREETALIADGDYGELRFADSPATVHQVHRGTRLERVGPDLGSPDAEIVVYRVAHASFPVTQR